MEHAHTHGETSLRCLAGWHSPETVAHWNHGYYFSRCRRCGTDLVRTAYSGWQVPKGAKVVWSEERPASAVAGNVHLEPAIPLPIEEVLRHLEAEPAETESGYLAAEAQVAEVGETGEAGEADAVVKPAKGRRASKAAKAAEAARAAEAAAAAEAAMEESESLASGSAQEAETAPDPVKLSMFPDFMDESFARRPFPSVGYYRTPEDVMDIPDRGPNSAERLRALWTPVQGAARRSRDFAGSGAARMSKIAAGGISTMAAGLRARSAQNWTQPLAVLLLLLGLSAVLAVISRERSTPPVVATPTPAPTAEAPKSLPSAQPAFVAAQLLNCRDAPSLQADTVRRLERGDEVSIQAVDQDWANIAHQRGQCWVLARYLSAAPPSERG